MTGAVLYISCKVNQDVPIVKTELDWFGLLWKPLPSFCCSLPLLALGSTDTTLTRSTDTIYEIIL